MIVYDIDSFNSVLNVVVKSHKRAW